MTGCLAPDPQSLSRLTDPKAARGEQNDPRPFRQLLGRRMGPNQRVQVSFVL
jgi:hypothetical protein